MSRPRSCSAASRASARSSASPQGVDILVATPGRLTDLVREGDISLAETRWLVLDEADRMLDMGFINDVRRIAKATHRDRQTALFSATMPAEIEQLAQSLLKEPVRVEVSPQGTTAAEIKQSLIMARTKQKRQVLSTMLADEAMSSVLVFARTKHGADRVVRDLERDGFNAAVIHGNKSQNARQKALNGFRDGSVRILVATDIAARGIDVPGISHVVNFDLPDEAESYVHRVGRTGRNGADGIAVTLVRPVGGGEAAPGRAHHPHEARRSPQTIPASQTRSVPRASAPPRYAKPPTTATRRATPDVRTARSRAAATVSASRPSAPSRKAASRRGKNLSGAATSAASAAAGRRHAPPDKKLGRASATLGPIAFPRKNRRAVEAMLRPPYLFAGRKWPALPHLPSLMCCRSSTALSWRC